MTDDMPGDSRGPGPGAGGEGASTPPAAEPPETPEQRYMRHMRNAIVFIAVMLGVSFVLGLVVAIVMGVQIGNIDSQLGIQSGNSAASNCVSQGGTNPGC
ncbi:MAG: hypothetical protein ACLP8X_15295 [Streptosporangiaceae bacterium]